MDPPETHTRVPYLKAASVVDDLSRDVTERFNVKPLEGALSSRISNSERRTGNLGEKLHSNFSQMPSDCYT